MKEPNVQPHRLTELFRLGKLGRVLYTQDTGQAYSVMGFQTHLEARLVRYRRALSAQALMERIGWAWKRRPVWNERADGRFERVYDLGSGLVTNVGVLALANDWAWTPTNAPFSVFRNLKYHASGKGVTAAAATDIKLETVSTVGGQTPVAGTQVLVSAANVQKYQSVATIAYTGTEAVTEWAFLNYSATLPAATNLTDATGSPFTAGSATTGTVTATPLTASSASSIGQSLSIIERTSGTNQSYGLVTSNTTSVVTVPAWYLTATGAAGQNPANTETYVLRPLIWDHKVFSAINVVNLDSIQFTYTLTINSGG